MNSAPASVAPASVAAARPPRFDRPSPLRTALFLGFLVVLLWSLAGAGLSVTALWKGLPAMGVIAGEMMPPATDRLLPMMGSVLTTFQMALVGTVIGVALSLPLGVLAAANLTPHPLVRDGVRALVSFFRTVPDLAWDPSPEPWPSSSTPSASVAASSPRTWRRWTPAPPRPWRPWGPTAWTWWPAPPCPRPCPR
jgi:hypothetical protein